jgi:hypothetical protein
MKKLALDTYCWDVLVADACTSMFMVGKGERRGGFLGSNSKAIYNMLCASAELVKVLEANTLKPGNERQLLSE